MKPDGFKLSAWMEKVRRGWVGVAAWASRVTSVRKLRCQSEALFSVQANMSIGG